MTVPFPSPTGPARASTDVFLHYLEFFRDRLVSKLRSLPETELRDSRLPSGWTPLQLIRHLRYVELRWLVWGFEGADVGDPWGDQRDGRWYVEAGASLDQLEGELAAQARRSTAVIRAHELSDIGKPGERWDGGEPASLERVLFHLLQEYARHIGQLDIVTELAGGATGE